MSMRRSTILSAGAVAAFVAAAAILSAETSMAADSDKWSGR